MLLNHHKHDIIFVLITKFPREEEIDYQLKPIQCVQQVNEDPWKTTKHFQSIEDKTRFTCCVHRCINRIFVRSKLSSFSCNKSHLLFNSWFCKINCEHWIWLASNFFWIWTSRKSRWSRRTFIHNQLTLFIISTTIKLT